MSSNQTADLELTAQEIKEYNYYAGLAQSLQRLENNPDFQKLILEDYFKNKAINGVSMLGSDYIKKNGLRGEIMEDLVAISKLQDYFITVRSLGTQSITDNDDDENVEE